MSIGFHDLGRDQVNALAQLRNNDVLFELLKDARGIALYDMMVITDEVELRQKQGEARALTWLIDLSESSVSHKKKQGA